METVPGAESYLAFWIHRTDFAVSQLMAVRINRNGRQGRLTVVNSFHTRFTDDTGIEIGNSPTAGVFVPNRAVDSLRWPAMKEPVFLYDLHRRRVERLRGERQLKPPPPADPAASIQWLLDLHHRTVRRQFDHGYYWRDEAAGVYCKTIKGTFLMTWKLLWPWKQLRLARHARKLRRELAMYPDLEAVVARLTAGDKLPPIDPATLIRLDPAKLQRKTTQNV
jgi:hypothetical protein